MEKRGQFTSKFGFIMASIGSAIGLGNLWGFPYKAGMGGGFAFILVYLIFVGLVGFPIMLCEFAIGRKARVNQIDAYRKFDKRFTIAGVAGTIAAFFILAFYGVLGGWVVNYAVKYGINLFSSTNTIPQPQQYFNDFVSNGASALIFFIIFMVLTVFIVIGGVENGIEKASKIMMPILFLFLILIIVRSLTLPGASKGIEFLFKPDFSKLTPSTLGMALSQMFFSLSLGIGAMITYGSYLSNDDNIQSSAIIVPLLDTVAAILAGLAIFPAVFALGLEPTQGPSLMFITLPAIFNQMYMGNVFGFMFFVLILFAALSSSIALLEIASSFFMEHFKLKRKVIIPIIAAIITLWGTPVALSFGVLGDVKVLGMGFLDFYDFIGEYVLMTFGALAISILIGWVLKPKMVIDEMEQNGKFRFMGKKYFSFTIKFIAPILILAVMIMSITSMI